MRIRGWRVPVENCSGFLSLQDYEEKQKLLNHSLSGWSFDNEDDANKKRHSDEAERLHHMKSCKSMERHISSSRNGFARRRHQHEPNLDANDISNNRKQEKFSRSPVSGRAHRGHCRDSHLDNDNYSVDEEREKNSHSSTAARARRRYQHDIISDHGSHSHDKEHEKGSRSSIIGKERGPYHSSNRLSSDVDDMPSGYSCYGDDEYRSHIRSSKKHSERTHQYPCDSTQGHHRADVEKDAMRNNGNSVVKRYSRKNSCTESDLESGYLSDPDEQQKQIDFGHGCTHYGLNSRPKNANLRRDRWLMVKGSNEDVEDHSRYKRKRVY